MRRKTMYAALCAALVLTGWFAGSRQPTEAQTLPGVEYVAPGTWSMSRVQGGAAFIYNDSTGVIYRVYTGCGDDEPDGCVRGPLPITADDVSLAAPTVGLNPYATRHIPNP